MASVKQSIATRIALVVLAIPAVLLPGLYYGLGIVVHGSHAELFVLHARTFARNLAEELEVGDVLASRQRVTDVLDLAILNADGVYAELLDNGRSVKSELGSPNLQWPGRQDFGFGTSGDAIYFIALPVARPGHAAELRLGFDERPTLEQIRHAMQRVLWALAAYLAVALALAISFGLQLSRPVMELTRAARRIASGNFMQSLKLDSGVRELHDLGADLEYMRKALVGLNQRLRAERRERESAEVRRLELERTLQHRHRVETVGTLAGGIAHEINNALLPIMLLADSALVELPPSSPARADLEQVLASARRAKEIVAKVLTFSRDTGVSELAPIDLEAEVREALRLFALLVPPNVQVRVELAGPYPPVRGDPGLAVQLVMNLCTNGYQALGRDGGTLTVALSAESVGPGAAARVPPGRHVVLTVSDTGHGMSARTLERIFEPFFTTREVGQGSGLGLAVVDGIAGSFGATIEVESQPGRGTTFRVYFPVAKASAPEAVAVSDATGDGT